MSAVGVLAAASGAPNPTRKPLWRRTLTETPVEPSIVAIIGSVSPMTALAYCPISSPALKLSVAKSASVASMRLGRRVERDHEHARVASLLDGRHDRLGVARRDQNALAPRQSTMFSSAVT